MDTPTDARHLHSDTLIGRLRRLYIEQQVPPGRDTPLTFEMLRHLCRLVVTEGYNDSPAPRKQS